MLLHKRLQYSLEWGFTIQPRSGECLHEHVSIGSHWPLQECGRFKNDNMTRCKDWGIPALSLSSVGSCGCEDWPTMANPSVLTIPRLGWCVFFFQGIQGFFLFLAGLSLRNEMVQQSTAWYVQPWFSHVFATDYRKRFSSPHRSRGVKQPKAWQVPRIIRSHMILMSYVYTRINYKVSYHNVICISYHNRYNR